MKKQVLAGVAMFTLAFGVAASAKLSDAQVKQEIIRESIARYPGNCPCPYNSASNGSRCGRRSAYSRGGGYAPVCYAEDVTDAMVKRWRANNPGS